MLPLWNQHLRQISKMISKCVNSMFELTAVWRRAAPRLTLHCSTFLYRIQVSRVWYVSCWYTMTSLLRDRVLAMARDLLQFRASCAKSHCRHWAGITLFKSERTKVSRRRHFEHWFLEQWVLSMKSHRYNLMYLSRAKMKNTCRPHNNLRI